MQESGGAGLEQRRRREGEENGTGRGDSCMGTALNTSRAASHTGCVSSDLEMGNTMHIVGMANKPV